MSDIVDRLRAALRDRYVIERELGQGGMATVYLARDLRHQRRVALKVLRPELAATMGPDRFLQEVRVTANLQHPHILALFDSGEADGFLYYVMPYLEGESLRERLDREGELPVLEAVRILREVTDALATAHQMGVVHRDIKPDNVMLSGRHAVVTDFGVAKAVSEATGRHELTTAGVALGTPAYMAPEQATASENIDHRADIYAVGALGYELLAGHPPFTGATSQQVLAAHVTQTPLPVTELRSSVPPALGAVLMRCLEKKPADRWQSAEQLLSQLEAFSTPGTGVTPAQMMPTEAAVPASRTPLWLKTAVPVALVLGAFGIWQVSRGAGPESTDAVAAGEVANRLVVLPLQNLTADPELDVWGKLAADQIARAIDQPRPVPVVPSSTVTDAIRSLGDGASTQSIASAVEATHALTGTVALTGGRIRFEAELLDARSGQRLRTLDPVTGPYPDSTDALIAALSQQAAAAAVVHLGPDGPPWSEVQSVPVTLAAYQDYLEQSDLFCAVDYPGSIEAGKRALAGSPEYVPAMLVMMIAYNNLGMDQEADSMIMVLDRYRGEMMTIERLQLDWMTGNRTGNPDLSERAAEEAYRVDPSGMGAIMGYQTAWRQGRMADAIERFEHIDLDGACQWRGAWTQGAGPYHALERFDEELALARHGLGVYPGYMGLMDIEIRAFAGMGRIEAVDSLLDVMAGLPPDPAFSPLLRPLWAGLELRAHGHDEAANRAFQRALEALAAMPPAASRYNRGRVYYYTGRWEDADTVFESLLEEQPAVVDYLGYRGASLARLGRREEALEISARVGRITGSNLRGIPLLYQAIIAAALGDRDDAVRLLREAFAAGADHGISIHREPAFEDLRGYSPFDALTAPK